MTGAAFFDLDKTVIAKASMVAFGRTLYREGLISRTLLLRALWGQLVYMHLGASDEKLIRMRDAVLSLTRGWEQRRIRSIVEDALETVIEPIIYAEAMDLIEMHRAAGRPVILVSASPEEIVVPLGRYLRVDGVIATKAEIDADGRYTGSTGFYCYGVNKVTAMQGMAEERQIDLSESYAYSDSASDIPMLEVVGHPTAVNPDRELARAAAEHGWDVREFVRPVRLRDRVPMPAPAPTAMGAAVAGLVAGGLMWWRLHRREQQPTRSARVGDVVGVATRRAVSWRR
ncbi:MAG: HAD family hydrolase [Acidimicrobiales bacterium]